MAKKDKPSSKDFDAQREAEARAAKKKLKEAEKAKSPEAKKANAEKDPKKKKKARRFLKDFRGEIKKIVWPDFKTVIKNTGIVLVTVVIIGAMVWVLDYILTGSVKGLKNLAQGVRVTQTEQSFEEDYGLEDDFDFAEGDIIEVTEPVTEPATEPAE